MDGFLLVDKPQNWTSFDVVNKIRFTLAGHLKKRAKQIKVGHSGTLDPMATGLLIILIGSYTKRQAEFMGLDKTYSAEITLGGRSTTDDKDGAVKKTADARPVSEGQIKVAIEGFKGEQMQVPPQFSAIKKDGKRAYKSARDEQEVELAPRPVTVNSISGVQYQWPKLSFNISVSSGTYIRSIARDLGEKLGVGGYLSRLVRTSIGPHELKLALSLDGLDGTKIVKHLRHS